MPKKPLLIFGKKSPTHTLHLHNLNAVSTPRHYAALTERKTIFNCRNYKRWKCKSQKDISSPAPPKGGSGASKTQRRMIHESNYRCRLNRAANRFSFNKPTCPCLLYRAFGIFIHGYINGACPEPVFTAVIQSHGSYQ